MSTSEGRLPDLTVTAQGAGSSDVAARVGPGPAGGGQRSSQTIFIGGWETSKSNTKGQLRGISSWPCDMGFSEPP